MRTARECGVYAGEGVLLVALELSSSKWRLAGWEPVQPAINVAKRLGESIAA